MKGKNLLSISDLSPEDAWSIINDAVEMKKQGINYFLAGQTLALLFEKPSLRTRVSFDVAMNQLGGHTIYLSQQEVGLGSRESISDVARTLSRYVDIISARTFSHATLELLAEHATVPVINALSDLEHPCQALADLTTIFEHKGTLEGITLAFIGDGNNVANSLLLACALLGVNFKIASPKGYEVSDSIVSQGRRFAQQSGAQIVLAEQPRVAAEGADVVYTDVWTSMGQETELKQRRQAFTGYQVNDELLSLASENVIFMHPLPAHHGEEVAPGLIDSPRSVVFDQAENRLHAQKALLFQLLETVLQEKYEQLLTEYEKSVEQEPDDDESWVDKVAELEKLGQFEDALACYDEVIERKPRNTKAWVNKGITLGKLGRHDEALSCFETALKYKPDNSEAWINKGVALGSIGQHNDALSCFENAIRHKPDDAEAWANKAVALQMLGHIEQAQEAHKHAQTLYKGKP